MRSVVENFKTGKLELAELPAPICRAGSILVANRASLISAGTERAAISLAKKSLAGKAIERPDLVRQVLNKVRRDGLAATVAAVRAKLDSPVALGYSSAGVVIETAPGVTEYAPGDRVACAGAGYATHSEFVGVPKNLTARIPDGVSFEDASYVTLGAIAMHGVRQAALSLGESAAVIGCGLLGLLTVQILTASGVRVFAVDTNERRLQLALKLGASASAAPSSGAAELADGFTGGAGCDAVLITAATKSSDPLNLAAAIARDRGKIVAVGDVGLNVRRRTFYEKELTLLMSRSYGPGRYDPSYEERGVEYPLGYVRWGEKRNLEEFLRLIADGKVDVAALTTHSFDIADAIDAYDLVLGKRREPFIGLVLKYPESDAPIARKVTLARSAEPVGAGKIGVGFVGAGAFSQSVLLPALAKIADADPIVISSAGGLSAGHAGKKFGFREAATDFDAVISDERVKAVVIATRHNLHAEQTAAALAAGKHVYVEKPLALDLAELGGIRDAYRDAGRILMVGFNRRFSPHAVAAKALFGGHGRPLVINYRINAGVVPGDSWVQDPSVGGGRVLGEVCHFVDLATYFTGALPVAVTASRTAGPGALPADADSVVATIQFADGSLAAITYVSSGDASFSKERVEVAGGGSTAVIEDFRRTEAFTGGRRKVTKTAQDKGHSAEMRAFFNAVKTGMEPITFEELEAVTLATTAIERSMATGAPVNLSELDYRG
jgi:polar amino acid transport system substrate-binding protein